MTIAIRVALLAVAGVWCAEAQAPRQLIDQLPPSPSTKVVTIAYTNPFDQSQGEALVELPRNLQRPVPMILTPHAANWTQEMNRSVWSGVADTFNVIILYPRHQGKINPRLSLGSPRQLANLLAAVAEVERLYPVDKSRVYAAGLSQGAVETLLLAGRHPKQFAGALAINPIADFPAFYEDVAPAEIAKTTDEALRKLRTVQWPALRKACEGDFGGTLDAARAEYYLRSPMIYSRELATVPLILYWAEDDELIPNGATRQGGVLAQVIRGFQPAAFREEKHTGGHGYPFYGIDLVKMKINIFPREIFIASVKEMLGNGAASGKQ